MPAFTSGKYLLPGRMTVTRLTLAGALTCSLFAMPVSAATFLGDEFEGSYRYPHLENATVNGGQVVVAPSAQFTFVTGNINPTAVISASNVLITFAGDGKYKLADFNGILLKNLSNSNIAGLSLNASSTVPGFDQSRLSFSSDSLFFNFAGLAFRANDQISANVAFAETAVPEPGTWALMLLGLGLIGGAMRSSRSGHLRSSVT
jgi:hypothetical protein